MHLFRTILNIGAFIPSLSVSACRADFVEFFWARCKEGHLQLCYGSGEGIDGIHEVVRISESEVAHQKISEGSFADSKNIHHNQIEYLSSLDHNSK